MKASQSFLYPNLKIIGVDYVTCSGCVFNEPKYKHSCQYSECTSNTIYVKEEDYQSRLQSENVKSRVISKQYNNEETKGIIRENSKF